jgi:protein-S-isoprenylcysteine O-methyltransferase Ste14
MLASTDLHFRFLMAISFVIGWFIRFKMTKETKNLTNIKSVESKRENIALQLGNLAFGLPFIYIVSTLFDFAHIELPAFVRWLGIAVLFTGNAVFFAAHKALGKNWSGTLDIKENHSLVTNGIYNYIRHPMYLGFYLLAIGVFLSSANWLLGLATLGFTTYLFLSRVDDEEKMMIDTFGDSYRQYMNRTGRLLPKF